MTKVHGFEEVLTLFILSCSAAKRDSQHPLHPSLPDLQLIAALQKRKKELEREKNKQTENKARKRYRVLKH